MTSRSKVKRLFSNRGLTLYISQLTTRRRRGMSSSPMDTITIKAKIHQITALPWDKCGDQSIKHWQRTWSRLAVTQTYLHWVNSTFKLQILQSKTIIIAISNCQTSLTVCKSRWDVPQPKWVLKTQSLANSMLKRSSADSIIWAWKARDCSTHNSTRLSTLRRRAVSEVSIVWEGFKPLL